ncbi:2-oxo acid dehydrogenase subunit E2 [Halobaculum sp. P14]|uniref:2-oxo acid dehydrogenase subunit E2 n=1 Tax=Halobaculum sp. P14 TaxID=3421638 RepID=UPI003EBE04B8
MAERTFELPDLGEGIAEGELVSWTVQPGERVEEDQVIAEVETDKALVEVPSPYDGTVVELHAAEGEMVPVDSVIVTFDVDGAEPAADTDAPSQDGAEETDRNSAAQSAAAEPDEDEADGAASSASSESAAAESPGGRVFASPSTRSLARELGVDLDAVAGSGPGGRVSAADVRAAADSAADEPDEEPPEPRSVSGGEPAVSERDAAGDAEPTPEPVESDGAARDRTLAMPATRRRAAEAGVDINDVPASEARDGEAFVTPADVEAYVESAAEAADDESAASNEATSSPAAAEEGGAVAGAADAAGTPDAEATPSTGGEASGERVPYKGVRRAIGEQMARSKYTAPHVSHHDRLDAAELVELREELAAVAAEEDVKLTYLPFVVKAVTAALEQFPYLNSSLDETADEIVLHDEYNVGIAVATDAGLMVPVVKHADRKGLKQLAVEIDDLATRARNRELSPDEMQGGTFTITNIGAIGGEYSSPIINHPEAAILAMGPVEKRPWVVDDEVVARETMTLSMSVDHRLVDGAEAAQFSNRIKELLSDPTRLLLE